jgi:hypothetical protein
MRVSSYSKVDAVEQRDIIAMVNSGARGTKDRNLRTRAGCTLSVPITYPITFKYLVPVIYSAGAPGGVVASGSLLVLPQAAEGTHGQYTALCRS